ncbi:restriction endonuclease subunit S [Paenibacillus nanensis]|uniref:Restriction endonuclease subunit S n=1 Tax=Paenibacillus nanensis TaxID=393251 RepID=A0A3A1VIF0_9BACL|nr:restriction endonuclease subunit S [Paenibacillus nanensis]RIX60035.1 restriction endonuclease subunit S [Paenibacillus nanensis]
MNDIYISPPDSYKKTAIGMIPSDWGIQKFKEITDILKCGIASTPTYVDEGVPFLSSQNVKENKLVLDKFNYVSQEFHEKLTKKDKPQKGDILYTRVGASFGKAAVVDVDWEFSVYVSLTLIRMKKNYDNIFYSYLLNSDKYVSIARQTVFQGGGVQNLNVKVVEDFDMVVPPIKEQQKIASILSTWDKAIELKEKLIEQKKEQKKGLMQLLMTGKVRLSGYEGDWTHYTLGTIVSNKSGSFDSSKEQEVRKCVELEHINSETATINGYIGSDESKSMKNVFYKGDILFGKLRPYLRKYWQASFDGVCSSEIWVLKPADSKILSVNYLRYIVQTEMFIMNCNKTTGSKMPRADWGHLSDLTLHIPPIDEQESISNLMNVMDKEIGLLITEVKALEEQKKGLMQLLLTGKVRVKV